MIKTQVIKQLSQRYRPREKLTLHGSQALSNIELWALIISSGTKQHNALDIAKQVAQLLLTHPHSISSSTLQQIHGIGPILSSKILACLELMQRKHSNSTRLKMTNPKEIFMQAHDLCRYKQEHCLAFYLNGRQELLARRTLSIGGLNYNYLEAREIFAPAIQLSASHIILAHNHPSGSLEPSDDDLLFTKKIIHLTELMGLTLLDHLIVGRGNYLSLRETYSDLFDLAGRIST